MKNEVPRREWIRYKQKWDQVSSGAASPRIRRCFPQHITCCYSGAFV